MKKLEKENKEKHVKEMKELERVIETMFDYPNLKYRLSDREIQVLTLYFGLNGHKKLDFADIALLTNIDKDSLDKILKDGIFKLSVVDEKVEI